MDVFLGMLSGFAAGHIVITLPNYLLPPMEALWHDEFPKHYPNKKWIVFLYPFLFVGGVFGSFTLMSMTRPYVHFNSDIADMFYLVFWIFTGFGITNGFFEITTGVSPVPIGARRLNGSPFYFKAPWLNKYRYDPKLAGQTRLIGWLRISLSLFLLFLTYIVGSLSLL